MSADERALAEGLSLESDASDITAFEEPSFRDKWFYRFTLGVPDASMRSSAVSR